MKVERNDGVASLICDDAYLAAYFFASALILALYFAGLFFLQLYASLCAGLLMFGSSSRSCIPRIICLTVIAGLQSVFKIERQMLPLV